MSPRNLSSPASVVALACVLASVGFAQPAGARVEIAAAAQPRVALGGAGRVWLVYGQPGEAVPAVVDHAAHADGKKAKGHASRGRSGELLVARSTDGGQILALGGGRFGAVFQRNGEVFLARGEGPEMKLGAGKQPVAVQDGNAAPVVIWQQGTDLVRMEVRDGAAPVKVAAEARFPSVVALPGGAGLLLAYERGPARGATAVVIERR